MFASLFALVTLVTLIHTAAATVVPEKRRLCPDGKTFVSNAACCSFVKVRDDLISDVFEGICGENAHSTVRIAFHDAIGFSLHSNKGGGADGSIIQFGDTELNFAANAGIDDIVADLQPFADAHGISYGDVIQFGSSVALSLCPGAPIVQTFVGRPNATAAAPDGTVPDPFDPVDKIFARMEDAGFSPFDLVSLLASHSIAAQDEIQPDIHGSPFDSTPGSFDPQVFLEVLLKGTVETLTGTTGLGQGQVASPIDGEFRLQSDFAIARDPRTACTWQSFISDQALMARQFATVMAKLGLTGHNPRSLVDCTELIRPAPPAIEKAAVIPAGHTRADIQQVCRAAIPPLKTQGGVATPIPVVPGQ